jgi:CRISPR-associated protein Cas2
MNAIIAYDIRDDTTRARIAALLSPHGIRLQRSVFECLVDETTLTGIVDRAEVLLDLRRDVLQVFPQCESCRPRRFHLGQAKRELDALYWIV